MNNASALVLCELWRPPPGTGDPGRLTSTLQRRGLRLMAKPQTPPSQFLALVLVQVGHAP